MLIGLGFQQRSLQVNAGKKQLENSVELFRVIGKIGTVCRIYNFIQQETD
jgi:hypothetical protein